MLIHSEKMIPENKFFHVFALYLIVDTSIGGYAMRKNKMLFVLLLIVIYLIIKLYSLKYPTHQEDAVLNSIATLLLQQAD